ncbi:MAG: cache domain-containing protein [Gemmataceae bacterium]
MGVDHAAERHPADQPRERLDQRPPGRQRGGGPPARPHRVPARFVHEHATELAVLQKGPPARASLRKTLERLAEEAGHRELFDQYSVANAGGYILAGYPAAIEDLKDEAGNPRCWMFRDWFNGCGDQLDGGTVRYPPIRGVHISQPYESRTSGRPFSVNFSVPILAEDRTIGVLTAMVPIRNLHTWLDGVDLATGCVLLFNDRGHCLKHNRMDRIIATRDANPVDWRRPCSLYRRALSEKATEGVADAYLDPIDEKEYLAGYARFLDQPGRTPVPWLAVVQHERTSLLRPVADLKTNLFRHCLMALAAGSGLIVAVWSWLMTALRREVHGLRT